MMHSAKQFGRHQHQVSNYLSAFQQRIRLRRFVQWKPAADERLNLTLLKQPEQDGPVFQIWLAMKERDASPVDLRLPAASEQIDLLGRQPGGRSQYFSCNAYFFLPLAAIFDIPSVGVTPGATSLNGHLKAHDPTHTKAQVY
jgi:hypothetical protein